MESGRRIRKAAPKQLQCTCEPGLECAFCTNLSAEREESAEAARQQADESPLHSPVDWGSVDPSEIRWAPGSAPREDDDPRPLSQCGLDDSGSALDVEDAWNAIPDFAPLRDE